MQNRKRSVSKPINILTWILIILGIIAVIGLAGILINRLLRSGTEKQSLIVEYDGAEYTGNDNFIDLPVTGPAEFVVRSSSVYKLSIIANPAADFDYTVDGRKYPFGEERALTDLFDLSVGSDGFIVNCTNEYSIYGILSEMWVGSTVVVPENDIKYPFKFVISTKNAETVEIAFRGSIVTNIELDKENIIL